MSALDLTPAPVLPLSPPPFPLIAIDNPCFPQSNKMGGGQAQLQVLFLFPSTSSPPQATSYL